MSIKRVVPDIKSKRMGETRKFYTEFLGFDVAMDMGWVLTFASPDNQRRAFIALVVLSLVACSRHVEQAPVVSALEKLADSPSKMVLYSLDPGHLVHNEAIQTQTVFHGYHILGHADITNVSEQRALMQALARGASEAKPGVIGACFNPRHGLHIEKRGHSVDLVICFECLQVHAFDFQLSDGFLTSPSPQPTFDDSLRRYQLPLASK
jgi:hypothetical protein